MPNDHTDELYQLIQPKGALRKILANERLIDDIMMTIYFENNIEDTQYMIRVILKRDDITVESVKTQYSLNNLHGRSIRLDILARDANGKIYDIEFQRARKGTSPKRLRYYQSLCYANFLQKGQDYDELPELYIIMITEENPFKTSEKDNNIPIYHVKSTVKEAKIPFDDGVHILYVNAECRKRNPLGKLIEDLYQTDPVKFHNTSMSENYRRFKYGEYEGEHTMNPLTEKVIHELLQERFADDFKRAEELGEKRGEERGEERGRLSTLIQSARALMEQFKCDAEKACSFLKCSEEDTKLVLDAIRNS